MYVYTDTDNYISSYIIWTQEQRHKTILVFTITHMYTHIDRNRHICKYICRHIHLYICTHMHTHTHIHTYVHTYTCIHNAEVHNMSLI